MRRIAISIALSSFAFSAAPLAAAACWQPVPGANSIVFTTTQAGAPFQGQFTKFAGVVCLGEGSGRDGRMQVSVQTASVDTDLPELDAALRGPDFFDTARWPQASFTSESIKALGGNRYQVTGKLTLRDVTREIAVPFTFTPVTGGGARLDGKLDFERLDYHIGLGQWRDTRWVGDRVEVTFSVALTPAR
ncbi:MAG: YceI family protein [Gammaproteobacteria bacterium]|nr:YceI family protein [Gammaproteobacteria bacterium]MBU6509118.1 YceI family protein [Gammaproteobacteria bacterium]MDE1984111.1 YceI family protein [Gammaproteobacteria bacterium]MDE2108172.1 YceI family protein [Gammaproteobacteria bacterium]MDE2460379.1 YceI family protein [Gammaproteobacteria bacterium]